MKNESCNESYSNMSKYNCEAALNTKDINLNSKEILSDLSQNVIGNLVFNEKKSTNSSNGKVSDTMNFFAEASQFNVDNSGKDNRTSQEYSLGLHLINKDISKMHVDLIENAMKKAKQQNTKSQAWPFKLFYNNRAVVLLSFLGIVLIVFGIIIAVISLTAVEIIVPYSSNSTNVSVIVNSSSGWDVSKPGYKAVKIDDFYDGFRYYYDSRPQEFFGSYSCGDMMTYASFIKIRPNISHLNLTVDMNSTVFPCGASSFAVFDDQIIVESFNDEKLNPIDFEKNISKSQHFKYILFTNVSRPDNKTIGDDWFNVTHFSYRNWLEPQLGTSKFLTLGEIIVKQYGSYNFALKSLAG